MGRIALWVIVAHVVLVANGFADAPEPPPPSAVPEPSPAPLQRSKCRSNVYLEPAFLFGGSRAGSVLRLHAAFGFRYSHCPTAQPESFRVLGGVFVQAGSEAIGDAFNKGVETEVNVPVQVGRRLGGRAYVGFANHGLFIVGGGVRYRADPMFFGFEMIYSSRSSEGQGAAIGAVGVLGFTGKGGAIAAGVLGALALVALLSFNTT